MSNLVKRIIAAALLAPVFIFIIYKGGVPFFILNAALFFLMFFEWMSLVKKINFKFFWAVFGFVYIGFASFAMLFLERLRGDILGMQQIPILLFTLIILVWLNDIFSFVAGKSIGGPKLAPKISPNKTWAGAIGGVAACVIFFFIMNYLVNAGSSVTHSYKLALAIHIIVPIIALLGDLFESYIKRKAGVKDSGSLIPGHGGLLDRFDGLLLVMTVTGIVFAYLYFVGS